MNPKIKNVFDWLNEITEHKSPVDSFTEEDWGKWNTYMIHRFISMNIEYVELANYIQTIPYEEKKQIYTIYKEIIPKKKAFFRYIKAKKKTLNKDLLKHISQHFECSIKEANEYMPILSQVNIKHILSQRGIDEKEQKKLLKK